MPNTLHTSQHEGSDARDEPGEEGVEGEGAHQHAVGELNYPRHHHVGQVGVHQLQAVGRAQLVLVEESTEDGNYPFGAHLCRGRTLSAQ